MFYVKIGTTDRCNLRCKYCFEVNSNCRFQNKIEENRQLQNLIIKNVVRFCEYAQQIGEEVVIDFWGGEPFLNVDYMIDMIDETNGFDNVTYHIYSNGTITGNIEKFLEQKFIPNIRDRTSIQFSYDGEPHNTLKRGDYRDIILSNYTAVCGVFPSVQIKATLSYDMLDKFSLMWDSFRELNLTYPEIDYNPTLDETRVMTESDYNVMKQQLDIILQKEIGRLNRSDRPILYWFNVHDKMKCGIDKSVYIHTNGDYFCCQGCVYCDKPSTRLGNIQDTSLVDIYTSIKEKSKRMKPNQMCNVCCATYCAICHSVMLDKDEDAYENWMSCISRDVWKCETYKYFGNLSRIYQFARLQKSIQRT